MFSQTWWVDYLVLHTTAHQMSCDFSRFNASRVKCAPFPILPRRMFHMRAWSRDLTELAARSIEPWRGLLLWQANVSEVRGFLTALSPVIRKSSSFLSLPVPVHFTRQPDKQKRGGEGPSWVIWCPYLKSCALLGGGYHKYWFLPLFPLLPIPIPRLFGIIISDSKACSTLVEWIALDKAANSDPERFLLQSDVSMFAEPSGFNWFGKKNQCARVGKSERKKLGNTFYWLWLEIVVDTLWQAPLLLSSIIHLFNFIWNGELSLFGGCDSNSCFFFSPNPTSFCLAILQGLWRFSKWRWAGAWSNCFIWLIFSKTFKQKNSICFGRNWRNTLTIINPSICFAINLG